jgi:hypothetical protein
VITGMTQILNSDELKVVIIELNGSGGRYSFDETLIHQELLAHDFVPVNYDPLNRLFTDLETFNSINTIYIRDIHFVNERVKSSEPFKVFNEKI